MGQSGDAIHSVLRKPTVIELLLGIFIRVLLLCLSVAVGLIIGWAWRPSWVASIAEQSRANNGSRSSALGWVQRVLGRVCEKANVYWRRPGLEHQEPFGTSDIGTSEKCEDKLAITEEDLRALMSMLEEEDGGALWQPMMDKSTQSMSCQAWRRDSQERPTEYRQRTVFENVTPQLTRDFFWDDEFRMEWDDMLRSARTLEECPRTGFMVVQWVRKFPFFCKDREYIIARRIWQHRNSFYCITKGVDHPSVHRKGTPRRVDTFYSSFRIRQVESLKGNGLTASEVMLFHYEDMGIQKDIAKLGVRQGMWGYVTKLEPGIRKYMEVRKSKQQLSKSALMAQITTQIPDPIFVKVGCNWDENEAKISEQKKRSGDPLKWVVLIGAVALACGVEKGGVGKFFLVGIARRFGKIGKRL
ncbi:hypothetical protein O6H91_14G065400 [Diphasiastrum complanatum]|uniref:Uncharacterized protein n=1 Tax=Diphasiastrum complanatum TaxID=34168 RepID=A0ACC2BQJ1_DIPCM|nr:hypothetical protein O6H91_14G065400 [Diphasiastrum complanatum]